MSPENNSYQKKDGKKWLFLCAAVVLVYIALHIYLCSCHEAWRDEAQAWGIAGSSTLTEIFGRLGADGHPCLWFLVIAPLAKLGFPFGWLGYFTTGLMAVSVWLWLVYAPLPKWVRLITLTGSIFLYYNSVIARIYALTVLIVLIVAIFFRRRMEKPFFYSVLVALLFQSHILFAGLGMGLLCEYFLRRKDVPTEKKTGFLCGGVLQFLSMVAFFLEMRQIKGASIPVSFSSVIANLLYPDRLRESAGFIGRFLWGTGNIWISYFLILSVILCFLLLSVLTSRSLGRKAGFRFFVIAFLSLGVDLGIFLTVRQPEHTQMVICMTMVMLFLIWIYFDEFAAGQNKLLLNLVLVFFVCFTTVGTWQPTFPAIRYDISRPFSNSREMGEYISAQLPENSVILVGKPQCNLAPAFYGSDNRDDIRFICYYSDEPLKYMYWEQEYPEWSPEEIADYAETQYPDTPDLYLLEDHTVEHPSFAPEYSAEKENLWKENNYLYRYIPSGKDR